MQPDVPNLRPSLLLTELTDEIDNIVGFSDAPDPIVVRAALARFLGLPVIQRSAVILKDVLGHSLGETAETMSTTVMAVKAALVRGRAALREQQEEDTVKATSHAEVNRYASLFNARDWDGVRSLLGESCKLGLVSKSQRQGKAVGMYFGNYAKLDVTLRVAQLEGRWALRFSPRCREPWIFHPARVPTRKSREHSRLQIRPLHRPRSKLHTRSRGVDTAQERPLALPATRATHSGGALGHHGFLPPWRRFRASSGAYDRHVDGGDAIGQSEPTRRCIERWRCRHCTLGGAACEKITQAYDDVAVGPDLRAPRRSGHGWSRHPC